MFICRLSRTQELSANAEGNVFASTYSVNLLLLLLSIGAQSKTGDQLKSLLRLPKDQTQRYEEISTFIEETQVRIFTAQPNRSKQQNRPKKNHRNYMIIGFLWRTTDDTFRCQNRLIISQLLLLIKKYMDILRTTGRHLSLVGI